MGGTFDISTFIVWPGRLSIGPPGSYPAAMLISRVTTVTALISLPLLTALGSFAEEPTTGKVETLADLVAQGQGPDAASTCGMCHTEIHAEWKDRKHGVAWTDPIYQAAMLQKTRPQLCHACHIPDSVLERVGSRPRTRDRHLEEGVTCVACHKKGNAQQGPYGSDTLAHLCEKNEAFSFEGSVTLCASCHSTQIEDVLPVAKDFLEADMASKGMSCIGCHMPEVERQMSVSLSTGNPIGEVRKGRSHALLGTSDVEFVATAFGFATSRRDENLVLSISDLAGHRIPGFRLRTFPVDVRQLDDDGNELRADQLVISDENALQAGETRDFTFPLADGVATVEVQLHHHFEGERVATILTVKLDV